MKNQYIKRASMLLMSLFIILNSTTPVLADMLEAAEARKSIPVESNQITNWPEGPTIGAESAILMDAETGTILYEKNIHAKEFPASTTKVLTCLVAIENSKMDEMVTFSKDAVFGIEKGSSNVGMDVGQSITMEEAIYCIMLASANEVATAVAEHVGGTVENFAAMMNQKAKELGCTETNYVNANGLHNDNHYTSAHDLALITAAYFKNEQLQKIASTRSYEIKATATQPDTFLMSNHHKMLQGQKYYYEYVIGGKTGYTNTARQTLTTCAEKDGMKLVCVIMREESPSQFTDTKDLFEYGFSNFQKINIADNETKYTIDNANFFKTDHDIFGNSKNVLSLNPEGYIILPNTAIFSEAVPSLSYDGSAENVVANLSYTFEGIYVGGTTIDVAKLNTSTFEFGNPELEDLSVSDNNATDSENTSRIFINITYIIFIVLGIIVFVFFIFVLGAFFKNYHISKRRKKKIIKKKRRYYSEFDDYNF
ncbi:MAG: D-alanyl-D-alanine carboxypeptidase [Lachnospiraceae bacterium]|nr:D-alanyl-D-alanine carboxypeptidase [Lachnospiraceae bacterium]